MAANSQCAFKQHIIWDCSYIRHLLSNVFLNVFNSVLSSDSGLPKDLKEMRFVGCDFLKPNYINHIMKYVSFSSDLALPCNS